MTQVEIDGIRFYFDPAEAGAASIVEIACRDTVLLLCRLWSLKPPTDCRVYLMTDPIRFVFDAAPALFRPWLWLSYPLWAQRVRQTWQVAGGWEQRFGRRVAVGIKPPRLIETSNRELGDKLFYGEESSIEKARHVTCHELTHGFTSHLKFPAWLKEGLAMVAVDELLGKQTVRADTLRRLEAKPTADKPLSYRELYRADGDQLITLYARGYWLVRYLHQTIPGFLQELLDRPLQSETLDRKLASAFDAEPDRFWMLIDSTLLTYFRDL